jgi:hypothetical protein
MISKEQPVLARTPAQSQAVLNAVQHLWTVEWSCGIGAHTPSSPGSPPPVRSHFFAEEGHDPALANRVVIEPALRLVHPACIAAAREAALQAHDSGDGFQYGPPPSSPPAYAAESVCQLVKLLYEHHFRCVLRDKGHLGRAAIEWCVHYYVVCYLEASLTCILLSG